jgi:tRNA-Thr(GGU) m(6)t(6)A37 methyltransferase TsaA
MDLAVPLQVIGVVRTAHTELATTPIQAGLNRAGHGIIEIGDRYREGLEGLAEFDYAWLHNLAEPCNDPPLRQVPFPLAGQQRTMGMFAARGPRRINPIGLSLIRLLEVAGPTIRFAGVDLLDGTPVIDLKPVRHPFRPAPTRSAMRRTITSRSATASHPHSPRLQGHQPDRHTGCSRRPAWQDHHEAVGLLRVGSPYPRRRGRDAWWLQSPVARITSDALITAVASLPTAGPRSRTASTVMDATGRTPLASNSTLAIASPAVMPVTLAGIWLRAKVRRTAGPGSVIITAGWLGEQLRRSGP